jgi:hypothetical protein
MSQFEIVKLSSVHCKSMFDKKGLHNYATAILSCVFIFILQTSVANTNSYYTIQETTVTNNHNNNNFHHRRYPMLSKEKVFKQLTSSYANRVFGVHPQLYQT